MSEKGGPRENFVIHPPSKEREDITYSELRDMTKAIESRIHNFTVLIKGCSDSIEGSNSEIEKGAQKVVQYMAIRILTKFQYLYQGTFLEQGTKDLVVLADNFIDEQSGLVNMFNEDGNPIMDEETVNLYIEDLKEKYGNI